MLLNFYMEIQVGETSFQRVWRVRSWARAALAVLAVLAVAGALPPFGPVQVRGEGSKELVANGGCRALTEWRTSFYGNTLRRRTFLKVYANAGEIIKLGSSAMGVGSGNIVVWNPGLITTYAQSQSLTLPASSFQGTSQSGKGALNTRAKELAGPLPNSGGYDPCTYTAPTTGVYWVAFYGPSGGSSDTSGSAGTIASPTVTASQNSGVSMFDITVRDSSNTAAYSGRVYTDYLVQQTGSNGPSYRVYSTLYAVTKDGFKYQVDMRGLDPNAYVLYGNTVGFLNPDGVTPLYHDLYDGLNDTLTAPKGGVTLSPPTGVLFFNPPDASLPASIVPTPLLPSVSSITFSGSAGGTNSSVGTGGNFVYAGNVGGVAEVVIAPNPGSCTNANFDPNLSTNRVLRSALPGGVQNLPWNGKDNAGNNMPVSYPGGGGSGYCYKATLHAGEYHFPLLDAENSRLGGPTITLLNPPGGTCPLATCRTAFFDDRGYKTTNGTTVGTVGSVLPGTNPPPSPYYSTAGFDTASTTVRAFGNDGSTGFGDKKGMDLWTYYPSPDVTGQLYVVPANASDLAISKIHSGDFTPGADNTYTISVRNVGTAGMTGTITVTDAVPASMPVQSVGGASPWSCSFAGQNVTCTATTTVAAGASLPDITLTVRPNNPPPTSVTNTATVSITGPTDTNPANNTSSSETTILSADLAVTKTAIPTGPSEGAAVAFTVQVTNNGPSMAEGVSVADTVPAGLAYVSHTVSQGAYAGGVWTVGTLLSGASATLTLNVTVNVGQSGQTIDNTATASGGPYDYVPGNNSATCSLSVAATELKGVVTDQSTGLPISGATVQITDSASHTFTATTGADGGYTIVGSPSAPLAAGPATVGASAPGHVTATANPTVVAGASTTQNLVLTPLSLTGVVTDLGTGVPIVGATVTFTQGATTCSATTGAGGAYTFTHGTACPLLAGPASVSAAFVGYEAAGATPTILATGPTTQNLALGTADLVVTKTDGVSEAHPGETLSYVLTVVNNGSITAYGITLDDTLPTYTTYVSDDSGVSPTPPGSGVLYYRWALGSLAPGATKSFTLQALVASTLPDGTTGLSNYAYVNTTTAEKDKTNNEVSDLDTVTAHPDLTVAKAFTSTPPAGTGSTVVYRLSGGNVGHATATGVTIVDTLDALNTYQDASASLTVNGGAAALTPSYDNGTKKLTLGMPDLAPGDAFVLNYSVTVGTVTGAALTNTAVIGETQTDADTSNNTAGVSVPTALNVDVYALKSDAANPDPAVPGGRVVYTIAYGNNGGDAALGVTIQDALPASTTLVAGSITGGGTESGGTVTWTLGTLASKAAGTVSFAVQIADQMPAGASAIGNTATISTTSTDAVPANNTSSTSTPVTAAPDLVIAKTDGQTQAQAGDALAYTITYQNVGNRAATGVTIVDTLLDNVVYVGSSPSGTYDAEAGTVTWAIGALADFNPHTLTLSVTVKEAAPPSSVAADRITISDDGANGTDPNPANNTATDSDLVVAPYIVIEKHGTSPAYVGNQLTYTIDWRNTGAATANGATIQDALPANTTLVAGSITGGGTYDSGTRTITWALGSPIAGASGSVSFAVIVGVGAGGSSQTSPTLSTEAGSGSTTVTSSSSALSLQYCEAGDCKAFRGIYQGANGTPPTGWNDNPRMTDFDYTGWTQPVYQTDGELFYWTDHENLSAEWVTMNIPGVTFGNFSFFRQAFALPLNATGLGASLEIAGDDVSDIYLNGVYLGRKIGAGAAASFDGASGVQSGANILAVQLLNNRHGGHTIFSGADHSGLLFNMKASYTGLRPFASAPEMVKDGQSVAFSIDDLALGGRSPYVYKFDFGDGTSVVDYQSSATYSHTYAAPGVYTATLTARDHYGCTGTDQVAVTVLSVDSNLLANTATVTYKDANNAPLSGTTGAGSNLRQAADLSISKTVVSGGTVPGQGVQYQIVVANSGPNAVTGAVVADTVPASVGTVTWTCTSSGGSCGNASGSGNTISETVNLPSGASATLTVQGTIDPAATGTLANTATAAPPTGVYDLVPGNDSSTASTTLAPVVDLSVTKTSAPNPALPGEPLTYTITVSNSGPSAAVDATVADTFPAFIGGVTWTAVASAGSSCTASGTGAISDTVYLKSGGTATYSATGVLDPSAAGPQSNTASASPASGTTDSNPANNSATDGNTPVPTVLTGVVTVNGTAQAGVIVTVVDSSGTTYTTNTIAGGVYTFTGSAVSPLAVGIATVTASYASYVPASATPALAAGANTQNLALADSTRVSGVVFYDQAGTGTLQSDSYRFEGVAVALLDTNGGVLQTTATAADGGYSFAHPAAGDYKVRVTDPLGYVGTTVNPAPITVVNGTPNDVNFGEKTDPTHVVISRFDAAARDGRVVVEWETALESGTVGFFLYRHDPVTREPLPVHGRIVPAFFGATRGGTYRLFDPGARPGETYSYTLREVASGGKLADYGPFVVTADRQGEEASFLSSGGGDFYERRPRPASLERGQLLPVPNASSDAPGTPDVAGGADALDSLPQGPASRAHGRWGGLARMAVRHTGLHFLASVDIARALGLRAPQVGNLVAAAKLKLTSRGQAVAYMPDERGAGLYFYGEASRSPYASDNVYWLGMRQGPGELVPTLDGQAAAAVAQTTFASTSHGEQNVIPMTGFFEDPEADFWMWDYVVAGDPSAGKRTFAVRADGAASQGQASITARFLGVTDPAPGAHHRARVTLNGAYVGQAVWAGGVPYEIDLPVDPALLHDGPNTVEVEGVLDVGVPYSIFCVDSFDVSYRRTFTAVDDELAFTSEGDGPVTACGFSDGDVMVFEIGDPVRPKRVNPVAVEPWDGAYRVSFKPPAPGLSYLAVAASAAARVTTLKPVAAPGLKEASGADYVIVTTGGLTQPAAELASYRQGRGGLVAKVVDVQDIYDEFNFGVADPRAIHDFLKYAYANWLPAPRYVLLAGAGSYDYKGYLGYGDCLVPPVLVKAFGRLSAGDGVYGDVAGDDGAPEIAVGRLPVLTPAEFRGYIEKIRAYEAADPDGWSSRVLMLADDYDPNTGNFPADSNFLAAGLPADHAAQKVYLGPLSLDQARGQMMSALGAGIGVFNYVGHGGIDTLAAERLLASADVAALRNGPRLPFMSAATCVVGDYAEPGYRSLGVLLALQGDGGMAAVFSPTGLSFNSDGATLDAWLFESLFGGGAERVGDAIRAALAQFAVGGCPRYVLETYNLLGDPAMELRWR